MSDLYRTSAVEFTEAKEMDSEDDAMQDLDEKDAEFDSQSSMQVIQC